MSNNYNKYDIGDRIQGTGIIMFVAGAVGLGIGIPVAAIATNNKRRSIEAMKKFRNNSYISLSPSNNGIGFTLHF